MGKALNLTGQRFGRLVAIRSVGIDKHHSVRWLCECDCGRSHVATTNALRNGACRSCGCTNVENILRINAGRVRHNYKNDPDRRLVYQLWKGMRKRCRDVNDKRYSRYGGRRIKVCPEWDDPVAFVEWAMQNGYRHGLQIDRRDNDGDYSPENCRFVSHIVNRRNSSIAKLTEEDAKEIRALYSQGGIRQVDIARKFGISQQEVSKIVNDKLWQ